MQGGISKNINSSDDNYQESIGVLLNEEADNDVATQEGDDGANQGSENLGGRLCPIKYILPAVDKASAFIFAILLAITCSLSASKNCPCGLFKSTAKGMLARAGVGCALQERSQCHKLPFSTYSNS